MAVDDPKRLKYKFDIGDRNDLDKAGSNGDESYAELLQQEAAFATEKANAGGAPFTGFPVVSDPLSTTFSQGGPFEVTPNLAQLRLSFNGSCKMVKDATTKNMTGTIEFHFDQVVDSLTNTELKEQLKHVHPIHTLPASIKVSAASVGDNPTYRNMCHVKVFDATPGKKKLMNTPHIYRGVGGPTKIDNIGYPLQLLTDEGGFLLEEPPQVTDTFRHYINICNSMLSSSAYKQESPQGTHIIIPKNSDAARLMYFVLVIKNGKNAPGGDVTGLDKDAYQSEFRDKNDSMSWRFPEHIFQDVSDLLAGKLTAVREKSYNCSTITLEVSTFDVYRQYFDTMDSLPMMISLEIDLHLPMSNHAVAADVAGEMAGMSMKEPGRGLGGPSRKQHRPGQGRGGGGRGSRALYGPEGDGDEDGDVL